MCSSITEFLFLTILILFLVPILISNLALSYIDKPRFKITNVYKEFTKNIFKKNITNTITNDLLLEKLNKNLELMIDVSNEESYREIFNNTELYSHNIYLNNIKNLTHYFFSNKTGIDKLFFNDFYPDLKDLTKSYFNSIKINYYTKKFNNDTRYQYMFNIIGESWNNNLDTKFITLSNKLLNLMLSDKFKIANEEFECLLIFNVIECPNNYSKYIVNKNYYLTSNFPLKYSYYINKNVIECCNH